MLWAAFGPDPPPPAPNSAAFGCYATDRAPAIVLDRNGMHIRQRAFATIGFELERQKRGLAILAHAPISAYRSGERYHYSVDRRGIGWYLPFYREEDDQLYRVIDTASIDGFEMLATDGVTLRYAKAGPSRCGYSGDR